MVLDGEISAGDYKEMKIEIEKTLERLVSDQSKLKNSLENYGGLVDDALDVVKSIETSYKEGSTVAKQRIVASLYPEKLVFEKSGYRTPKMLSTISLINRFSEGNRGNKKGKTLQFVKSSLEVESEGFEPSSKQGINKLSTCLADI